MIKCAECGADLPSSTKFCSSCGTAVQQQPTLEPDPAAPTAAMTMPSSSALSGWLSVESGPGEGQQFRLRGTMRIGRTADNEIVIEDTEASRHHAAISQEAGGYSVQDLNSTNGTFLNEQRITGPRLLADGDLVRIGNTTLSFGWKPTPEPVPPPPPTEADPTMVAPRQVPPAGPQAPVTQPFIPGSPAPIPPQTKGSKRASRVPVVVVVLAAGLAVLLCVLVVVALYFVSGRMDIGQSSLSSSQAPPVITQVVTDAPASIVTMVVTNTPNPTPAPPPTATPISGPVTVRIAPDGSGDYATLEAAVDAVPPGSTILLDPGTYQLAGSLEIEKSLSLQGAGMDQTTVAGTEGSQVLLFTGPGSFSAQGVTFRHEGTAPARVVTIDDAEIDIAGCRFMGGIWSDAESLGGAGILLRGDTTGTIRTSHFEGNGTSGIELQDQSQPLLEDSVFRDNGESGLIYFDDSGGTARGNELTGNGLHGIEVREQAQPVLEANTSTQNAQDGIAYFEGASGTARRNTCSDNGLHGIGVNEDAHPTLEGNECGNNSQVGIRFTDTSGGTARGNVCNGNGLHGFQITGQAEPTLEGNTANDNAECGFGFFENAGGVARQNLCTGNQWNIHVADTASPDLVDGGCDKGSQSAVGPGPVSTGEKFGPLAFGLSETPAGFDTAFPAGIERIYAFFTYEGVSPGTEWTRQWYLDGQELTASTDQWASAESGSKRLTLFKQTGGPLSAGTYELQLHIESNLVQSGSFVIQP